VVDDEVGVADELDELDDELVLVCELELGELELTVELVELVVGSAAELEVETGATVTVFTGLELDVGVQTALVDDGVQAALVEVVQVGGGGGGVQDALVLVVVGQTLWLVVDLLVGSPQVVVE